ncbi:MAG: hypothetical protein ACK5LE_04205, partial [Alphaproteobacteria bacterium]
MTQNLDLESWQKKQSKKQGDFHDHAKNAAEDEFTIRETQEGIKVKRKKTVSSKNYYHLPPQYIEAMKNNEIIDVLTSNIRHERSLFLFKLIFTAFCLFFILMAFVIIIQEKQPAGFLFIIVPVFMLRQIFKARKKRYMVFGKKSFYYPPLLHRAIDYEEVVSVDYIMAEVRTTQNNQQKTYMRKLLQFVFDHEVMNSEYGGESRNLRIKAQYHSAIPADRQACI